MLRGGQQLNDNGQSIKNKLQFDFDARHAESGHNGVSATAYRKSGDIRPPSN